MDRVEFILRIIIRLKDEASVKLAAINTQVKALGNTAKTAQVKMDGLNTSISSMNRRLTGLQNRLDNVKSTVSQIGSDTDNIDNVSAAFAKAADAIDNVNSKRQKSITTGKESTAVAKEEAKAIIDVKQKTEELVAAGVPRRTARRTARELAAGATPGEIAAATPSKQPAAERAATKLNLDLVVFSDRLNEAGKKIFTVVEKETGELIAENTSRKKVTRAANEWLRKQSQAIQENVEGTEKLTEAQSKTTEAVEQAAVEEVAEQPKKKARREKVAKAEEKTALTAEQLARINQNTLTRRMQEGDKQAREELIRRFQARKLDEQFRIEIQQVGKRFRLLDVETEKVISTHKSHELALARATAIESENSDLIREFAGAKIEQTKAIRKTTKAEEQLADVTIKEVGQKSIALEGPAVQIVRTEDVAKFREAARTPERDKEKLDQLREEIKREGIQVPLELRINKVGKAFFKEGNHRLAIAEELGIQEIPVVVVFQEKGGRGRGLKVPGQVPEGLEPLQQIRPEDVGITPVEASRERLVKLQKALDDYERSLKVGAEVEDDLTISQRAMLEFISENKELKVLSSQLEKENLRVQYEHNRMLKSFLITPTGKILTLEEEKAVAVKEQTGAIKKETEATEQSTKIIIGEQVERNKLAQAHLDEIKKLEDLGHTIVRTTIETDDARNVLRVISQMGDIQTVTRVAGTGRAPGVIGKPSAAPAAIALRTDRPPVGGGSPFLGPGGEAAFEKQQEKVVLLRAEFARLQEGLLQLRREFVRGTVDEHDFFAEFDKFIKQMAGVGKRAPVDFGETVGREFRKATDAAKFEMEKLNKVRVDNSHLRSFAAAMELVEKGAINLNEKIQLTKGAVQILRKEGEQLKASGIGNIVDKLTASERLLIFFETELEQRRASGRGTKTLERDMGRLQSRILATREALRQLLVESGEQRPAGAAVGEIDVAKIREDNKDLEDIAARAVKIEEIFEKIKLELQAGQVPRQQAIKEFRDLAAENEKLARSQEIGTTARRQLQEFARDALAAAASKEEEAQADEERIETLRRLEKTFIDVSSSLERGSTSQKRAISEFKQIITEVNKIAKAYPFRSEQRADVISIAEIIQADIDAINRKVAASAAEEKASEKAIETDQNRANSLRRLERAYIDLRRRIDGGLENDQNAIANFKEIITEVNKIANSYPFRSEGRGEARTIANIVQEDLDVLKQRVAAAQDVEKTDKKVREDAIANAVSLASTFASHYDKARTAQSQLFESLDENARNAQRRLEIQGASVQDLEARFVRIQREVTTGAIPAREAAVEFRLINRELTSISNKLKDNRSEAVRLGVVADRAGEEMRKAMERAKNETDQTGGSFVRLTRAIGNSGDRVRNLGDSVATLDNKLRGLAVLAIFVFAQQLISVLVGVAGGLTAVASSAVQAGFALGGAFVAGISQAIPALGLFAAALAEVKAVTDAVNQAQTVKEQAFHRSLQADEQATQRADQLSTAQDSLRDAERGVTESHRRVAEAQRSLTEARKEARRNLLELIDSEKDAELAARGAALSQEEAQERLSAALLGGSDLALRQAEQGVFEATRGRTTADRRVTEVRRERRQATNIGQTDTVRNAERALRAARAAEDDAERSVRRTQRSFDQVGRNADKLTNDTFAAQSQLQFLLKQLSPAQLRLYNELNKIRETYKRTFTPITDILVDAFTRGVTSADKILQNPRFLNTARNLSSAMADSLDTVREAILQPENFDQILRIVENGADNLPQITDLVVKFGEAWLNVAEFSEPAVDKILGWVDDLAGDIKKLTDNKDEMESFFSSAGDHAVAWAELAKSAVLLFAAIASAGGSDTGLSVVEDLTRAIQRATRWVRDHREEVAGFFEDSRRVLNEIGRVLLAIGEAFASVFDPGTVEELGEFLRESFIPALELVVKGVGAITKAFLFIINEVPFANELARIVIAFTIFVTLLTSAVGAFSFLALNLIQFSGLLSKLAGGFTLLRGGIAGVVEQLALLIGKRTGLGLLFTGLAGLASKIRGPARGAAAAGSITDVLTGLSAPAGSQRVPRGGILGKLGFSKLIAAEGPSVVNAADDVAKQGAEKFGSGFLSGVKGFLKFSAWTTVGVAAVSGIVSGIKSGDIGHGVQDFMHSLTFGLVKSSGELAQQAIDEEILPRLKDVPNQVARDVVKQVTLPGFDRPERQAIAPGTAGIGGGGRAGGAANILFAGAKRTPLQEAISKLSDAQKDALKDFNTLSKAISDGVKRRESSKYFDILMGRVKDLQEEFPELTDVFNILVEDIEKGAKKVDKALAPLRARLDFAFDVTRHPNKWKSAIDDVLKEASRMGPGMQEKTRIGMVAMIDELERKKAIPAARARKMKELFLAEMDDLKDKTAKKSARMAEATAKNTAAMAIAVEASLALIGQNVNVSLDAFGVKEIKLQAIAPKGRAPAVQRIIDNLDYAKARGGVIGKVGERGRDLIPAWLGRGEMVFNRYHQKYIEPAVQHFYGHNLVDTFSRIHGEHAGPSGFPFGFSGGYAGQSPSGNKTVPIPDRYTAGTPEYIAAKVLRPALGLLRRFNMIVTDAFATAGHSGKGHLLYGTAMDAVPGPRGSWDTVDAAVAFARSKGLTVLYDGVQGHGRGHHAHFELDPSKIFGGAIPEAIQRQIFNWPIKGPMKRIGQAALDRVRKAANRFLEKQLTQTTDFIPHAPDYGPGSKQIARTIVGVARRLGASPKVILAAIEAGIVESGLRNLPYGDRDSLGVFQQRPSQGWGTAKQVQNVVYAATQFIRRAIPIQDNYSSAGALAQGVQRSNFPARYDQVHSQALRILHELGVRGFAKGGEIPGQHGSAVPIIAHAREWIVNPDQQERLSRLLGMSTDAIKHLLGFHGGPTHFQGGGEVARQQAAVDVTGTSAFEANRIKEILRGIFRLPAIPVRAWASLVREANRAMQAIDNIGNHYRHRIRELTREIEKIRRGGVTDKEKPELKEATQERGRLRELRESGKRDPSNRLDVFLRDVNEITKENGLLDQMGVSLERFSTRLSNDLTKMTFRVVKFYKDGRKRFRVEKVATDLEIADQALDNTRRELNRITGERGVIKETLQEVHKRLRNLRKGGVTKDEASDVRRLVNQQNELKDRLIQNVTDRQTAIQAVFEAQIARQQAVVDAINRRADIRNASIAIGQRIASLFGNTGALAILADQQIASVQEQMNELAGRVSEAQQIGNTELVDSLNAQIAELGASVQELATQKIQTAIDAINTVAGRSLGRLDLFGRLADAMGSVGLGGAATLDGQTLSRGQLFAQRGQVLGDQRTQLQQQLAAATSNALTAENNALINALNDQILDLTVQIAENTKAAFQARVEDVNASTSFQLNLLQLRQRIVELTGQISKTDTANQVRDLLIQRATVLEQQNTSLNALLAEAQASGDQQAINDLTTQLLENQIATLENTIAINQLTNQSNLQEFTSTAWQLFRTAIFDGLGNLLPRYAITVPSAQMGAHIMRGGMINVHPGEDIIPAKITRGNINGSSGGDVFKTDVNVTSPTEVADPVYLGNAIGWRIANNPNLRP